MERAIIFFCCSYVPKIPRMRIDPRPRTVLRIRGVEMATAIQAVAAQQVAELMHMKPVLAWRQVFNVTGHLNWRKRVVLFE